MPQQLSQRARAYAAPALYFWNGTRVTEAQAWANLEAAAERAGYERENWFGAWCGRKVREEAREFLGEISGYALEITVNADEAVRMAQEFNLYKVWITGRKVVAAIVTASDEKGAEEVYRAHGGKVEDITIQRVSFGYPNEFIHVTH